MDINIITLKPLNNHYIITIKLHSNYIITQKNKLPLLHSITNIILSGKENLHFVNMKWTVFPVSTGYFIEEIENISKSSRNTLREWEIVEISISTSLYFAIVTFNYHPYFIGCHVFAAGSNKLLLHHPSQVGKNTKHLILTDYCFFHC